jgi:hypothetical protein
MSAYVKPVQTFFLGSLLPILISVVFYPVRKTLLQRYKPYIERTQET